MSEKRLSKELVKQVLNMVSDCDVKCWDEGTPIDPTSFVNCVNDCCEEISRKLNIPVELICEIVRRAEMRPRRWGLHEFIIQLIRQGRRESERKVVGHE